MVSPCWTLFLTGWTQMRNIWSAPHGGRESFKVMFLIETTLFFQNSLETVTPLVLP